MEIGSLRDLTGLTGVEAEYARATGGMRYREQTTDSFDSVLSAAMNLLTETNTLQNDAQAAKIEFAIGEAENPHDMQIAEQKALAAIQYTTAIRDKMMDAYKEIMNMQI